MRLCNLLKGINVYKCNVDWHIDIEYIVNDHRYVKENYAFVALNGEKNNGNDYIYGAIKGGASVIITDSADSCNDSIPYVLVEDVRCAISIMWSNYYGNPSKDITTVAITGTNGKTSTSHFLYNVACESGISCGLISTVAWLANGEDINFNAQDSMKDISYAMTTPEPEVLYYLYNKMKEKNVKVVILEASSHALVQKRLEGIDVTIGVFTNLSREHLDYHKTMESYFLAKTLLVHKSKKFVVNLDDEYGKRIKNEYGKRVKGVSKKEKSDFFVGNIVCNEQGSEYDFYSEGCNLKIKTSLAGEHNVSNSMLAVACGHLLGFEPEGIQRGVEKTKIIKGRGEKYKNKPIYIDYAHTPFAMETVLRAMRQIEPQKRIIALFGCGGQRDKGKRAEMAKISAKYADFTIVTGDNPRNEPPSEIISDILRGFGGYLEYIVIPSRRKAIEYACKMLGENDALVLLGKGHEAYEINGDEKELFDERMILDEVFFEN